jgi:thioredoxin reductase
VLDPGLQPQPFKIKTKTAECWRLRAVIIATQYAAIRRITVQSQPGQIAGENLSQKKPNTKKD